MSQFSCRFEVEKIYGKDQVETESEKLRKFSSTKVLTLLNFLSQEGSRMARLEEKENEDPALETKTNLTTIIFVKMRQTAAVLCHVLEIAAKLEPSLNFVKADFAIGSQTSASFKSTIDVTRMDRERMKLQATLKKFKAGQTNTIVSTNVLEEGVDVKKCNLVIRFDRIPEFRSYVQSKGRARAKPSKFIIMVDSNEDQKVKLEIGNYREIELNAIDLCHKQTMDDDEPMDESEIETYLSDTTDPLNSPRANSLTAITKIYHYVQALPSDKFASLAPYFEFKKEVQACPTTKLFQGNWIKICSWCWV